MRRPILLAIFILVLFAPCHALAQGTEPPEPLGQFFIGAGLHSSGYSAGYPWVEDFQGIDWSFRMGVRGRHLSWEMFTSRLGVVDTDAVPVEGGGWELYPADSAEQSVTAFWLKYDFTSLDDYDRTFWVAAGPAIHFVNWEKYFFAAGGIGLSLGAGIEYRLGRNFTWRVGVVRHQADLEDDEGRTVSASGTQLIADFAWHVAPPGSGRPRWEVGP